MQGVTNVSSLDTHTSKEYHLYHEVNKKFVVSRDVIFPESFKDDNVVEWQLDCLDRFRHAKSFKNLIMIIHILKGDSYTRPICVIFF